MKGNIAQLKLVVKVLLLLSLCACQSVASPEPPEVVKQPTPQVIVQGDTAGKEEIQTIEIDNCTGKSGATRTEQRSQSVDVTISAEVAAKLGASAEVISAEVQAAVGVARTQGAQRSTSIQLTAPPGTHMLFQLVWTGKEQIGIVQNLRGSSIPIAFRGFTPTDVRIKGQADIGCPGLGSTTPQPVVPAQPPASKPIPTSSPQPMVIPQSESPTTPEEAARKWGGQPEWWHRLESNGWKLEASLTLTIGRGWRVDYTDPNGTIRSCGDKFDPGVYGPATINVTVATLWYVPGETRCPSWTIWSQSHP